MPLQDEELHAFLRNHPEWNLVRGELARTIVFKDFVESIAFVDRLAVLAEAASHHPDIDIRYNKVSLALITHDAGGITQNDINLAHKIDQLLQN